jgi:hypothetical protein
MMITGETVVAPALPGDMNDTLRKAYASAKPSVELRPAIDQTILNAARENARQSMPFYKKIPWYTQFSMAGAVFGSLFLSTVVIYKTVVHKHDKGIEELVTAEVAVKTEEARKKAPMVVSILAENGGTVAAAPAMVAATPMKLTPPAVDATQPIVMAAAEPAKKEAAASNIVVADAKRDTEASPRVQDKIVMADAASLSKDVRSRRAEQATESTAGAAAGSAAGLVVGASAKAAPAKAKEADIVVAALAPPSPAMPAAAAPAAAPAVAPARTLAPAIAAAPGPAETAPAWQTRIEILQRAGKTALAKTELQALLKRYPETVLTADLKRLLSD